ncbi:MAG: hypothetical protein PHD05_00175 [Sphaerochaetaceae bacterium]|nr:hypothetical protein [Sphaerochaetaceae bacterium]
MSKLNDPDFDMFKNWFNDPSTQENFKKNQLNTEQIAYAAFVKGMLYFIERSRMCK